MGQITGQQKQEAAQYAEDFLRGWLRLLEVEHLTQPGTKERIGHTISSAFRLRYFRHAEQNWPDELVRFTQRRAVHHPAFLDEFLPRWLDDLQSKSKLPPKTRSGLISFIKAQNEEKRRGTVRYDGWEHLLAAVIHNTSRKFNLSLLDDDYDSEETAVTMVRAALSVIFQANSLEHSNHQREDTKIPGPESLKKAWSSWSAPLRPKKKQMRSRSKTAVEERRFGQVLVETEEEIFYAFFLSTLAELKNFQASESK